jgi:hypothetical protein
MPTYDFKLTNGKTLTLEGDTQPSDADAEQAAKGAGVSLALADGPAASKEPAPPTTLDQIKNAALGTIAGVTGLGVNAISKAVHHPIDTAMGLASGTYVAKQIAPYVKVANRVFPWARGVGGALSAEVVPSLVRGAGTAYDALSSGAGVLAGAASEGASALMPTMVTSQQARDAINAGLRAQKPGLM